MLVEKRNLLHQQRKKRENIELIDLKAELFRKQEEFKRQKLASQNASFIKGKSSTAEKKKPNIWSKKNAGVTERAAKDYEAKLEEEDIFEKSRKSLENKAKLYEKISTGKEVPEEDGSGLYLVDFQKKVIDGVFEERDRARQEEEEKQRREIEEEKQQLLEPVPEPENEEEEWVDFVDSLGRSRRCLKKDLPALQRQDDDLKERKRANVSAMSKDFQALRDKSDPSTNTLLSDDMRRELQRQEWEKQELETMEAEKSGPIHYADVRHNEIRTHGVGFYQFDKDEAARQEQMQELNKLREQTVTERSKKDRIKEKRKAALEARLAKVKQRKKLKTGDLGLDVEELENKSDEDIGPKLEEKSDSSEDKTAEAGTETKPVVMGKKTAPKVREWDIGKERLLERSEASWLERQRAERDEEFAPPKEYYDTPTPTGHNPRPQQKWDEGKRCSVFSKIKQIELETFSNQSDETANNSSASSEQDVGVSYEPEKIQESDEIDNENKQTDSQTMDNSEVQGSHLPFGFNPSVPPPISMMQPPPHTSMMQPPPPPCMMQQPPPTNIMQPPPLQNIIQQPSLFPQQQTGASFSASSYQGFSGVENQPTNLSYFQTSQISGVSNEANFNANQTINTAHNVVGMTTSQNIPPSANYMPGTVLGTVLPGAVTSTTQVQAPSTVSSSFTDIETSSITHGHGNFGSQQSSNPNSDLTAYSKILKTEQKVIPKMKIVDTRLMQNDSD